MTQLTLPANSIAIPSQVAGLIREAFSHNTQRAWRADWTSFTAWCVLNGRESLPAMPETVAEYLAAEDAAGRAVATIRHRSFTITRRHLGAGYPTPCRSELVQLTLRGIAKRRGTKQRQAPALVARDADVIVHALAGDDAAPKDIRDVALMLVGRDLLARASELVGLTREAVIFKGRCALVDLRRHKTSTDSHQQHVGPAAAAALKRWLHASGIDSGPLWRSLTKAGHLRPGALSVRDVGRILKRLGVRARLEQDFSAHSLRVGMAHDLVADNIETGAIMQAAGWKSPRMLARYTEDLEAERGAVAQYYARRKA